MNQLTEFLVNSILEEEKNEIIGIYGGGFKPPIKGHLEVLQGALDKYPEMDEVVVSVGSGVRDEIDQEESLLVWDIYQKYLPMKVNIGASKTQPIRDIYNLAKDNPDKTIYWIIGAREGREDDLQDIEARTKSINKYNNIEVKVIQTKDPKVSGTNARKALLAGNKEEFFTYLPDNLTDEEKEEIFTIVRPAVTEQVDFKSLESQLDGMFAELDIDVAFTNHFKERVIERGLTEEDIIELANKIIDQYPDELDFIDKGQNIVMSHLSRLVDIAAVNTGYGDDYLKDLVFKTAYKRKDKSEPEFRTNASSPRLSVNEDDPKKGTGKKPKGSGRRLYTDEDPKDTVDVKFSSRQDIIDTLNKKSFKAKSHARQSQIINLIHQRVRAAYNRAKDPDVKKRLKTALDYAEERKEASKAKTQRLKKQKLNEHSMGDSIDLLPYLSKLTQHMIDKGYNIEPLPGLKLIDDDFENAEDFFGKTAYYDPVGQIIVLYTHGRHPKDIARSYAHEMIHHIQNLENRLGNITTTNTQEDDHLNDIEAEANLKGTMTFRNWTDSLQENLTQEVPQYFYHATYKPLLPSIKKTGLDTSEAKLAWEDSEPGIVYLANDPYVAESYAETSEMVDDEWLDEIIILKVASKDLDLSKLHDDRNVRSDEPSDTFEYHGVIPWNVLKLYKEDINEKGFDKKLGKDPFGLNQFARELMTEGAYDALTTKLTKATINKWVKDSKQKPIPKKSFVDIDIDEVDGKGREIEFNYVGLTEFTDKVDGYEVDGTSNSGEDKGKMPFVATLFRINPKILPQAWSKISSDVSDVIRHEIEHLTQAGDNTRSDKYMVDDIDIRDMINKLKILPKKNYYMLEKEVDAMLQGLYLKAKKTRKPFADVINNYLDMAPGIETPEDKEMILNLWRSRRKALSLPVFETETGEMPTETSKLFKIFLDMDGVIVDFDKRFEEQFGMPPREFEDNFGSDKFWEKIDSKGVGFWRGMDWMPGGQQLYNRVAKHDHALLSSPSRSDLSKIGKRMWRKDNTPNTKLILARSYNKKNYADKSNILIDDRADNIQQWKDAGGIGILYQSAEQVMKELDKLGL